MDATESKLSRIDRDGGMDNLLRLIHALNPSAESLIADVGGDGIAATLVDTAKALRENTILVHGVRVESMFAYVAGALGYCAAIKAEDRGSIYWQSTSVKVPDFRVLTRAGAEFFVEVKNCHRVVRPDYKFRFTVKYLTGLIDYSTTFQRDLKIAIYWSRIGLWTLVPVECFVQGDTHYSLSFEECVKASQMDMLGDAMVGSSPNFTLWLHVR